MSTTDYVVVETMPDCHRASHRAARNWGSWPHNGAERSVVSREEAEEIVAGDPDGYAEIVRDADEDDLAAAGLAPEPLTRDEEAAARADHEYDRRIDDRLTGDDR